MEVSTLNTQVICPPAFRDIRVLGAQKSDYQKMGAAHDFFFFESPFSQKKNYGRGAHNAPIAFFFLRRPFSQKKNHGRGSYWFSLFFCMVTTYCGHQSTSCRDLDKLWVVRPFCAQVFFFFDKPIFSKKKSWAVRPWCAHAFFFSAQDPYIPTCHSLSVNIL